MKLAICQTDPKLGDLDVNLASIAEQVAAARERGADLVLTPECALSGYGFATREEAARAAQTVPGPATDSIARALRGTKTFVVLGLLERDGANLFNTAGLVGADGIAGVYRKVHLPYIGADRFVEPGDKGLPVFELPAGRIGLQICFDFSFPEASRVQKLAGAQLLCVITNWPLEAAVSCDFAPRVRAQENHAFVATCDRVGEESGFTFRGRSRAIDCDAKVIAEASETAEETLIVDLDLERADANRVVYRPGEYEIDRVGGRRPEFYRGIAVSST